MKVYLRACLLLIFAGISFTASAQNPTGKEANIWYFGYKAGLDFNYTPPQALTNSVTNGLGGFASVCDSNGNLLFYTSPDSLVDRNHRKMPNSSTATGGTNGANTAVIVPWPGNPGKYFHLYLWAPGLRYSVVDMSLRGGLGDVLPGQKNIIVNTLFYDKITAVQHQNRRDVWVILHEMNTNNYQAFLVTPSGISPSSVNSSIGMASMGYPGALKISPDGRTLADIVYPVGTLGTNFTHIQLIDFNATNGTMMNKGILPDTGAKCLEFSPDGAFLYSSGHRFDYTLVYQNDFIYQYDLRHSTPATIFTNRTLISFRPGNAPGPEWVYGFMQVGPDGKIYMSLPNTGGMSYVGVIHKPNELGTRSQLVAQGIDLNVDNLPGRKRNSGWTLPTFIQSYFFKPSIYLHQSCLGDTAYHFSINNSGPVDSVRWDFGDPASGALNTSTQFSPWHSYATGGSYNVQVIAYYQFGSDTLSQTITIPGPPLRNVLGPDTTLCAGNTYTLAPKVPQALSYLWPDNSTDSTFQVTQPGTYWVEIETECGPYRDSVQVDFLAPPTFALGNDLSLCSGESFTLKPNLSKAAYVWQDGSTADSLVIDKPGTYWLEATNRCGTSKDSIRVTFRAPLPANLLGPDTVLCEGLSYTLQAKGNYTYQWQDGSTSSSFTVTKAGTYFADITNTENCTVRDSVTVSFRNCFGQEYFIPNIITPNNDGKNDRFVVWGAGEGTLELSIYNRWGVQVYQTSNYQNDWTAENASAGIYYYLLRNKETGKTYKGWLEVVK